jgi:hypothetical protein
MNIQLDTDTTRSQCVRPMTDMTDFRRRRPFRPPAPRRALTANVQLARQAPGVSPPVQYAQWESHKSRPAGHCPEPTERSDDGIVPQHRRRVDPSSRQRASRFSGRNVPQIATGALRSGQIVPAVPSLSLTMAVPCANETKSSQCGLRWISLSSSSDLTASKTRNRCI